MIETLNALLFIIATGGALAVGLALVPYIAMTYAAVVEQTAAGVDHVVWPEEPFLSRLLKLAFFAWQVVIWFILLWLPLLAIGPGKTPAGALAAFVLAIWLLFPISLLSTLSGESPLLIVYPPLFGRLKGRGLAILTAYGLTALFLAISVGAILLGLLVHWLILPLAAFVSMLALLLHSRVLGRLSWMISDSGRRSGKRAKKNFVEAEVSGPKPGEFPAPLPKAPPAIPMAIPLKEPPPAVAPSYFEAIRAAEPTHRGSVPQAILIGPGTTPLEEEHVPVVDVDEVNDDEPSAAKRADERSISKDLPPLPVPEDDEELELPFEIPPADLSLDGPIPGLVEPNLDEPGLLPLEKPEPAQPKTAQPAAVVTPYELRNEPAASWRAETGLSPLSEQIERAKPESWAETPRAASVERKTRGLAEKPVMPPYPLVQGVFDFPFYYRSVQPLLYMSLMGLLELLFIKVMILKFPTSG